MTNADTDRIEWKETITPFGSILKVEWKEIWNYRDLLLIWVKRDISSIYKQTILGPLWFFLQPILTTVAYLVIFSKVAKFSTTGLPPVIFYLSGIILWSYFADCITKTSSFLKDHSQIFSKVYFPRLIIPLSIIITSFIKFSIQFAFFLAVYLFYLITTDELKPTYHIVFFPVIIFGIALLGLGTGIFVASLTIKYKDLSHLITFGIQIMMFLSTVFFPLSGMADDAYKTLIKANPMSGFIETFRFIFTGRGQADWSLLMYDFGIAFLFLFIGIIVFNYAERTFVDTI